MAKAEPPGRYTLRMLEDRLPAPPARRSLHEALTAWHDGLQGLAAGHAALVGKRHSMPGLVDELPVVVRLTVGAMRALGWTADDLMDEAHGRRLATLRDWVRVLPPTAPGCEDLSCGSEEWATGIRDLVERGDVVVRNTRRNPGDPRVRTEARRILAESLTFALRSARNVEAREWPDDDVWQPLFD